MTCLRALRPFKTFPIIFSASLLTRSSGVHQMMDDVPLVATAQPTQVQSVTQKRQEFSQLLPWLCSFTDVFAVVILSFCIHRLFFLEPPINQRQLTPLWIVGSFPAACSLSMEQGEIQECTNWQLKAGNKGCKEHLLYPLLPHQVGFSPAPPLAFAGLCWKHQISQGAVLAPHTAMTSSK